MITEDNLAFFICAAYAFVLLKVSRPFAIAKILDFLIPLLTNQVLLAAASVVLSPGAPAPIVYILGASFSLKIILVCLSLM